MNVILCPACGERSAVINSRDSAPNGTWRRRRRHCPVCKTRWTTYEVPEIDCKRLGDAQALLKATRAELQTAINIIDETLEGLAVA